MCVKKKKKKVVEVITLVVLMAVTTPARRWHDHYIPDSLAMENSPHISRVMVYTLIIVLPVIQHLVYTLLDTLNLFSHLATAVLSLRLVYQTGAGCPP